MPSSRFSPQSAGHASFAFHFQGLTDPRVQRTQWHSLEKLLFIAVCASLSGSNAFTAIETFAKKKRDWLSQHLDFSSGVPSHDTFNRLFARLDPQAFHQCLIDWTFALEQQTDGKLVAIDGKAIRRAQKRSPDDSPLHLVSAWAVENQLSLGQVAVAEKSNEIEAIPRLLELLDLTGALVTLDAMGCQKEIAEKIIEQKADYVLSAKGNQPTLYNEIIEQFDSVIKTENAEGKAESLETKDQGHGREEYREYLVMPVPEEMTTRSAWKNLTMIGAVFSCAVLSNGDVREAVRYYIISRLMSVAEFAQAVRGHWSIENQLHWQLDVSFREDESLAWQGHCAENLSVLSRFTLSQLKHSHLTGSIVSRRYSCALNDEDREKVLFSREI